MKVDKISFRETVICKHLFFNMSIEFKAKKGIMDNNVFGKFILTHATLLHLNISSLLIEWIWTSTLTFMDWR